MDVNISISKRFLALVTYLFLIVNHHLLCFLKQCANLKPHVSIVAWMWQPLSSSPWFCKMGVIVRTVVFDLLMIKAIENFIQQRLLAFQKHIQPYLKSADNWDSKVS